MKPLAERARDERWGPRLAGFQNAVGEIEMQRRRQQYHQTPPVAVVAREPGADEQPDANGDAHAGTGAGAPAVKWREELHTKNGSAAAAERREGFARAGSACPCS